MRQIAVQHALPYVIALCCLFSAGCGSKPTLMPTPTVYTHPEFDPFANIPAELQSSRIEVLFVTDRLPDTKSKQASSPDQARYGLGRSRSAAFGVAEMKIGKDLSWPSLVEASRTSKRKAKLELSLISTRELGRFAPTPQKLVISDDEMANVHREATQTQAEAEKRFIAELSARLAKIPRKEVFMFVHGFNVSFEGGIFSIGEVWHFLGREGVPISYSWPAGMGTLRAYTYTEQSTRFTVFHLKQTLRLIASCAEVQKIHIIAHSRGTAVATDAIRELVLETRGSGDLKSLKLGTAILAAPDIDIDVMIGQNVSERIGQAFERAAVYAFSADKALAFSNWLTGGGGRMGSLKPGIFNKEEIDVLRSSQRTQIIESKAKSVGGLGHSYFHSSPEVSSDIVLLLRYGLPAGGPNGRPLEVGDGGFWVINDDYPGPLDQPWFRSVKPAD